MNEQQKEKINKRYNEYLKGIGRSYTWEETIAIAEQALADKKALHELSEKQILVLQISDNDIELGEFTSYEQLDKDDLLWLEVSNYPKQ
jgi:hypothetical protein